MSTTNDPTKDLSNFLGRAVLRTGIYAKVDPKTETLEQKVRRARMMARLIEEEQERHERLIREIADLVINKVPDEQEPPQ